MMHGEYMLFENGFALLTRDGELIRINSSLEDICAPAIDAFFTSPDMRPRIADLLARWNEIPLLADLPTVTEAYSGNYYHFSLDLIPRLRFFDHADTDLIAIPSLALGARFHRSLLAPVMRDRVLLPLDQAIRVRNPRLAHGMMSLDGVGWLRRTVQAKARNGARRIYVHRPGSMTRKPPGGAIVEATDFLGLLDEFGFERIDFGTGEHPVEAQISMLEGAGIILAAHGAGLTNLVYLNPPLTIIEVFGPQTLFAGFLHIADSLSFDYHGVMFETIDEENNIIVDCKKLRNLMNMRSLH